ncbi:MAG: [NiFe]-hydrogenase assembly chaperone HybE [Betaproteobacteria bacterium]|nr:[NiFe]-hydrogenase assembly chaperone HybE [Betaproteobacteria bacterium]
MANCGATYRPASGVTSICPAAPALIADDDPDLGPYQYCPLIAPVSSVPDMATARKAGLDALAAIIELPAPPVADTAAAAEPAQRDVSRRGFLRALTGRR